MGSPFQGAEAADSFDSHTFLVASRELLTLPSDAAVLRFLGSFPLSTLILALQTSSEPEVQGAALACLRCAVKSNSAAGELFGFLPVLEQGLFSPATQVQELSCLAAQRIGEVTTSASAPASAASAEEAARNLLANKVILRGLLQCLESDSTSLAMSAADAIVSVCSTSASALDDFFSEPTIGQISGLLTKPPAQVQQRIIALFATLSAVNPEKAQPIMSKLGVMEVLIDMIGGKGYCRRAAEGRAEASMPTTPLPLDELAALTACELLTDFVRQPGSARVVAQSPFVHGALLHLLGQTADPAKAAATSGVSPGTVGLVARAAWKSAAHLVSPPARPVRSPLSPDQAFQFAALLASVCQHLSPADRVLADASTNDAVMTDAADEEPSGAEPVDTKDWEEAVCEASSIMSSRVLGATLLLKPTSAPVAVHVCRGAFGCLSRQRATADLQVSALHSLASLLGSDRGEAHGQQHLATSQGVLSSSEAGSAAVVYLPENVELDADSEEALREAMYYSATSAKGGPTLGGVLTWLLKQEERVRVAVYRLLTVLVERPWGLGEVCGNPALVDALCDPLSETNKEAMDWRHTSVVAAATAASTHVTAGSRGELFSTLVPVETVTKLEGAAKMGPYALRRMVEARPIVIVEERPPMGN